MYAELALKLAMMIIDALIKKDEERDEIKKRLIITTAKYHKGVLDSSILRKEWNEISKFSD